MRRKLHIKQIEYGITPDELAQRIACVYEYLIKEEYKNGDVSKTKEADAKINKTQDRNRE